MQPDLEIDTELRVELLTVQAAFAQMVSERSSGQLSVHTLSLPFLPLPFFLPQNYVLTPRIWRCLFSNWYFHCSFISFHVTEFKPLPLSATEARLVSGITDLLANEPFEVTHSVLLHGFTACVVVKLKEGEWGVKCNGWLSWCAVQCSSLCCLWRIWQSSPLLSDLSISSYFHLLCLSVLFIAPVTPTLTPSHSTLTFPLSISSIYRHPSPDLFRGNMEPCAGHRAFRGGQCQLSSQTAIHSFEAQVLQTCTQNTGVSLALPCRASIASYLIMHCDIIPQCICFECKHSNNALR
jgi:hypothetical protein